jgi:hypothetical protein
MSEIARMIPEWVYNLAILILVPTTICYAVYVFIKEREERNGR